MLNNIRLGLKRILISNTNGGVFNKKREQNHMSVMSKMWWFDIPRTLDSVSTLSEQSLSKGSPRTAQRLVRGVLIAIGISLCSASPAGQATTMQHELTPARYSTFLIGELQTSCLFSIALKESNINYKAINKSSGASGAWQIMNEKVRSLTPLEQVEWAVRYAESRYGSACNAWDYWQRNYWW